MGVDAYRFNYDQFVARSTPTAVAPYAIDIFASLSYTFWPRCAPRTATAAVRATCHAPYVIVAPRPSSRARRAAAPTPS
ncbi:hypothetical protein BMD20_01150 [Burkholderia multivorans]|jgi:hypothetical protein|nr:hypothetical protein BMD22_16355 [Burkholderia multivorans]KHS18730.1 hypothetical protein BMD20_01150 [Burkholderia multivorans]MDR9228758.1 hypothetical protein [Burkholderia multivorans]